MTKRSVVDDWEQHVMPVNDIKEHVTKKSCWCRPVIEEEGTLIIHNSLDRREDYEHAIN